MTNDPIARELAKTSLTRACDYLAEKQEPDGSWRMLPQPRVLENALLALAGRKISGLAEATGKAERWLANAHPQTHHPIPARIDRWLIELVRGSKAPIDFAHPSFQDAAFRHRKSFFNVLALLVRAPIVGGATREELEQELAKQLRSSRANQQKSWSGAEIASLWLMVCDLQGEVNSDLLDEALLAIGEAQHPDGSIAQNPLSTLLVVAALDRRLPTAAALERARAYLLQSQQPDGTWRFGLADVWDTALLTRVYSTQLAPDTLKRARQFILDAQNEDGGWGYCLGVESDTDTTGMSMLALDPKASRGAFDRGQGYLLRHQTPEGVWRTWHYREDPPAEDVVAHAVLAMDRAGADQQHTQRAKTWLETRIRETKSWRAHWYNSHSYAAHEIGMALGRNHVATRFAAKQLLDSQNEDGGWSPGPGISSTTAATGMAIALLSKYLAADHEIIHRSLTYLVSGQDVDGAWRGATDMYAPRPFAVDYPFQTHALAGIGVVEMAGKMGAPGYERRARDRVDDYLRTDLE